ncbi:MAG: AsmA-like C-terminal region-containing protein [Bacteroidia bacterium]
MKKFFIILLSIIVLLIAAIIILPIVFKGKIFETVKTEVNKNLNAKVSFNNDLTLSLLQNFPNFTFGIKDLTVCGINEFEGDTLLSLKEFRATLDIMSVIKGEKIKVREILLDHPNIHAIVLKNGKANWNITKPSTDTTAKAADTSQSKFNIALKKFEIKNANIIYDDQSGGMYANITNLTHTLKGDFTQDDFLLKTMTEIDALTFKMGAVSYLSKVKTKLKMDMDANMKDMKFTFKENEFSLNELTLAFDGNVGMKGDDINMDIKYGIKKAEFKSFLSLIPAIYSKDFKDLQSSGKLGFDGFAKGTYNKKQLPAFALKLVVENGMFKYPALPVPVNNVQINLAVTNPDGDLNHTKIDLSKMHFEVSGDPFDAKLVATNPIKDPAVDASFKGKLNLDNVTKIVPLEEGMKVSGLINSDFEANAKVSDIEAKNFDNVKAGGKIEVQNMTFSSKDLKKAFNLKYCVLNFSPKLVTLSGFDSKIGKSDMKMDGSLENFIPYVFSKGTIKGTLNFTSNLLDANEFLGSDTTKTAKKDQPDTSSMDAPEIPSNMEFTLSCHIGRLLYSNYDISDFKGGIHAGDQKLTFSKVSLNMIGAAISMDGFYETTNPKKPNVVMSFGIQHLDFQKAFVTFNTVKKIAPIAENMRGNFSTDLKMTTQLDKKMNPNMETLFAEGVVEIPNAEMHDVKAINSIADAIKYEKLKNPSISNVRIEFRVEKGRVYTKPFDINMAGQKMTLSGSTGLDQTIDYTGKLMVPRASLGAANEQANSLMDQLNKQAGTKIKLSDVIPVNLKIGGTFTKPAVSTNMGNMAKDESKSLKDQAAAEISAKAKAEADRLKKEAEDRAKAEVDKAKKEAEDRAKAEADKVKKQAEDRAKAEADKAKKSAEEEAKKKLKGLFGK